MISSKPYATLLDVIVVFILATSAVAISTLMAGMFKVHVTVIVSLIITLIVFWGQEKTWRIKSNVLNSSHLLPIVMLMLIGLLFRSEPYNYIAGGQDEGIYVNMSKHYESNGEVFISDETRMKLPDDLKKKYDKSNLRIEHREHVRVEGEKEGVYLPGIYVKDQNNSQYVFQFYPLHPLWMSIFGKLVNDQSRVYSLVFFSLLSIISFYLITYEFTKKIYLSFMTGFILAINPLHAFFSKFPVTEVMALSLSSLSFYYLLKYYNNSKDNEYHSVYLILSSLLMAALFFTRISGFMYMPFYYLIAIIALLYCSNKVLRKHITLYILSLFVFYSFSVWYGLNYSYPYSIDIYNISFGKIFGNEWPRILSIISLVLGLTMLWIMKLRNPAREKLKKVIISSKRFIPYLFLLPVMLGFYKVYSVGFTSAYVGDPLLDIKLGMAASRWEVFQHWSLVVLMEYLTPMIFVIFLYALFSQWNRRCVAENLLVIFVLLFFTHICILQWRVPYQYYYARYLVSEVLPYIILYVVVSINWMTSFRKTIFLLVSLSSLYMIIFSTIQLKGYVLYDFQTPLEELSKYINKDDVVIIDERFINVAGEMKTPLKFHSEFQVLTVNKDDQEEFLDHYCSMKENVYFLSINKNSFSEWIKNINIKTSILEHSDSVPTETVTVSKKYILSQVDCLQYSNKKMELHDTIYEKGNLVGEYSTIINAYIGEVMWTKGTTSFDNLQLRVQDNNILIIETFGYHPYKSNLDKLNLQVKVNGEEVGYMRYQDNKYYFAVGNVEMIRRIEVLSNTFIPKEHNIGNDTRALGLDIKKMNLISETLFK